MATDGSSTATGAAVIAAIVSVVVAAVVSVLISPPWGFWSVGLAVAATAYISGQAVAVV